MRLGLTLSVLAALAVSDRAHAFPQMAAHGYPSCVSCHMTPSGGGLMSAYGRSLSREALSQWGYEGEERFLYGAAKLPDWLNMGGDIRLLQLYVNNATVEQASFFPMQLDVDAAVVTEKVQGVLTLGYQSPRSANFSGSRIFARRFYLQYLPAEGHYVRAGKFEVAYGVRWPDHFIFARRDLGWDEGSEAYRAEWVWQNGEIEVIGSGSLGRPDVPALQIEESAALRLGYTFWETSQALMSFYYGSNSTTKRFLFGPAGSFNVYKKLMLFPQIDFQRTSTAAGDSFGAVESLRLNYEIIQGLHLYAMQEFSQLDFNSPTGKQAYTLGAQWFPRPHIELAGGLRKQQSVISGGSESAWLLLHYYL